MAYHTTTPRVPLVAPRPQRTCLRRASGAHDADRAPRGAPPHTFGTAHIGGRGLFGESTGLRCLCRGSDRSGRGKEGLRDLTRPAVCSRLVIIAIAAFIIPPVGHYMAVPTTSRESLQLPPPRWSRGTISVSCTHSLVERA